MKAAALSADGVKDFTRDVFDDLHDGVGSVFKHEFGEPASNLTAIVVFHRHGDGPAGELENLGVAQLDVVADKGYYSNAEVSRCVERGLTPYLQKADPSANTQQGLFGKSKFNYAAAKDVYVCPAGQELTYRFNTEEQGRQLRYYRASDCKRCALKKQCTRNQGNRTITREADEGLMEAMAQRVKAHPEKMRLRKALCEHPFGTLKRWFGYTYFLVKGLAKVRCEWNLMTLVYNLKRVLNLVSFAKLMAAVGVQTLPSA